MKIIMLSISALVYALPFLVSPLWPLIFLFFCFLFYYVLSSNVSFKDGLLWGSIFFSMQESGIFYSLLHMADYTYSSLVLLVPLFVFLIAYQALYSGLWFFVASAITKESPIYIRLILWIITTFLFISLVDQYLLWIFGNIEGYPLVHPLLPLAEQPWTLALLPLVGKYFLTLVFLGSAGLIGFTLYSKGSTLKHLVFGSIAFAPWLISYLLYKPSVMPPRWLSQIAVLPESFYNPLDTAKTIKEVSEKLQTLIRKYPHIQAVLLPESALYLCDLSKHHDLLTEWDGTHLGRALHIITGAFCKENNLNYNTVYWIYDGIIKQQFSKRHALLLTEGLPQWAQNSDIANLYHTSRPYITPSHNQRTVFKMNDTLQFVPYICSELFLKDQLDDICAGTPIASFCNDTWIEAPYLERLMRLMHRFRALQWKTEILYIAYDYHTCYDNKGHEWPLYK